MPTGSTYKVTEPIDATPIPNSILSLPTLSYLAKGIYAFMLSAPQYQSLPGNFIDSGDSPEDVAAAFSELETHGLVER